VAMRHRNAVTETTGSVFTLRCSFIGFFQFALVLTRIGKPNYA